MYGSLSPWLLFLILLLCLTVASFQTSFSPCNPFSLLRPPCASSHHISPTTAYYKSNTTNYLEQSTTVSFFLTPCSLHLTVWDFLLLLFVYTSRSRDASGSGEGTSGAAPLLGNTSCHGLCQFNSIQLLSALSVYIECLQLLSQCGTGTGKGGFSLCGLPSPMLLSHFVFDINEIIEQGTGEIRSRSWSIFLMQMKT